MVSSRCTVRAYGLFASPTATSIRNLYRLILYAGLDETQSQYVLGGQACQWSEGINQHNFDARTWYVLVDHP